jgi:UDP-glucose 4-epimerase
MNKEYILVTGAAGFVGSAVANKLNSLGFKTITIDNLSTGEKEVIPSETLFIEGNLGEQDTINKLNDYTISAIFHIAGQSSGEISFENPSYDLQSNTESTLLLLKFAQENKIKHFIYASTMSVYGNQSVLPVVETTNPNPSSFYACGKLASENYLKIYATLGINVVCLRLFNIYGPGQNMKNLKQGMLSIYLAQALNDSKIVVKGSVDRFRDFVYIDDVVEAFLKAYKYSETNSFGTFNICTNKPRYVYELLDNIKKNCDNLIDIEIIDGTPGDQFGIFGSNWKAKNELKWEPKVDFGEGVQKMISWAKNNI